MTKKRAEDVSDLRALVDWHHQQMRELVRMLAEDMRRFEKKLDHRVKMDATREQVADGYEQRNAELTQAIDRMQHMLTSERIRADDLARRVLELEGDLTESHQKAEAMREQIDRLRARPRRSKSAVHVGRIVPLPRAEDDEMEQDGYAERDRPLAVDTFMRRHG